jgi:hypothetical protein
MSAAAGGVSAAAAAQGAEVGGDVQLSCGSHTDYGLLTLVLQQPGISALQVGCRMPVTGSTAQPAHGACPQTCQLLNSKPTLEICWHVCVVAVSWRVSDHTLLWGPSRSGSSNGTACKRAAWQWLHPEVDATVS